MKEYIVLYGTTEKETIKAISLLNAQKSAHKKAISLKTIVLSATLKDDTETE